MATKIKRGSFATLARGGEVLAIRANDAYQNWINDDAGLCRESLNDLIADARTIISQAERLIADIDQTQLTSR